MTEGKKRRWVWNENSKYKTEAEYKKARTASSKRNLEKRKRENPEAVKEDQRIRSAKRRALVPTTEEQKEYARQKQKERYARLKDDPEFQKKNKESSERSRARPEYQETRAQYLAKPETKEKRKRAKKEWDQSNKEHTRNYARGYLNERYKNNTQHRLAVNLRTRFNQAFKNGSKKSSAVRDLGMSIEEFKVHLEDQFTGNMSWANQGEWHIDHVKPLASFDLEKEMEQKAACHYTNLRLLWWDENNKKRDRFTIEDERRYYHERAYPDNY